MSPSADRHGGRREDGRHASNGPGADDNLWKEIIIFE
jgi:hypothetical protein